MKDTSLAVKYRPTELNEVVGQDHIVTLVRGLLVKGIANTILAHGPHSSGKTTIARLIGKYVNCEKGPKKACHVCQSCKYADEGIHPDIVEIDAATNRGIEQVRELIKVSNFMPMFGRYKVFVLDEVHAMTPQAFQSMLKILEEPPSTTIFILVTTEPSRLPRTIIARCLDLPFQRLSPTDVMPLVKRVAEAEEAEITEEQFGLVASRSRGYPRVALNLLEKVIKGGDALDNRLLDDVPEIRAELLLTAILTKAFPNMVKILMDSADPDGIMLALLDIFYELFVVAVAGAKLDPYWTGILSRSKVKIPMIPPIYQILFEKVSTARTQFGVDNIHYYMIALKEIYELSESAS